MFYGQGVQFHDEEKSLLTLAPQKEQKNQNKAPPSVGTLIFDGDNPLA